MKANIPYSHIHEYALGMFVLMTVLTPKLVGLAFLILVGVLVYGFVKNELSFQLGTIPKLLIALYCAYLVGAYFTDHSDIAASYLENKLSFLLLPLILAGVPKSGLNLNMAKLALVFSVLLLTLLGLVNGFGAYSEKGFRAFISTSFSSVHHPTYFCAYAFMALIFMYEKLKEQGLERKQKIRLILIGLVLILAQFLSMSLAGILLLANVLFVFLLVYSYRRYSLLQFSGIGLGFILTVFVVYKSTPNLQEQIRGPLDEIAYNIRYPESLDYGIDKYFTGDEVRLIMWHFSWKVFKQNPFGIGTGNVDEILGGKLYDSGYRELSKKNYNPHNQYLQTGIEIGVVGLGVFLAILSFALIKGVRSRNWLLIFLSLSLGLNCLIESMLQRQSGIVFYCFWLCLLAAPLIIENNKFNTKTSQ
jgi:O-antigen ligase